MSATELQAGALSIGHTCDRPYREDGATDRIERVVGCSNIGLSFHWRAAV